MNKGQYQRQLYKLLRFSGFLNENHTNLIFTHRIIHNYVFKAMQLYTIDKFSRRK